MATITKVNRPTTAQLLTFIRYYRDMEKSSIKKAQDIIHGVFLLKDDGHNTYFNLCDKWREKNYGFGQFFFNLSYIRTIHALKNWGINDHLDNQYLELCDKNFQHHFFNQPDGHSRAIKILILFFENHGIDENPAPGITLQNLPNQDKFRFGNTANWGDYVLSLENPDLFFDQVFNNISWAN